MRVPRLLLMFSLSLAACSGDPSGAAGDVQVHVTEVRTDPTISGPDVVFTVRNDSDAPVYVDRCGENPLASVDRWTGTAWEPFIEGYCALTVVYPPLKLEPGDEVDGAQAVHRAGVYRLRPRIYAHRIDLRPRWIEAADEFVIP